MKTIPFGKLLEPMPIKWRVQSFSKNKPAGQCVAYVDARQVSSRLDEVCGPENWQIDYKPVNNLLMAGIGINTEEGWVWKWDTGSESNIEKDKGHASDAFKRAAVQWGVGRFLYDLDPVWVKANKKKEDSDKPYDLWVVDDRGQRVWDLDIHINNMSEPSASKTAKKADGIQI